MAPVDHLVQVVVEAPVRLVGRLLVEHGRPGLRERLLARGPPGEGVRLRRRLGDVGQRVVVDRPVAEEVLPGPAVERDVVRVDEGGHGEPRPVAPGRGKLAEELDHLFGEDAVAHHAAVGLGGTVRLAADPAREAVGVEAVGALVGGHGLGDRLPGLVGGHAGPRGCPGSGGRRARCATCPGSGSRSHRPGTSRRGWAPSWGRATSWPGRCAFFAMPSVLVPPCSDGYCPVNSVVRLGRQAVDPA